MDSYTTSTGSCFMMTSTIFKNYLLEVDLTQNQETMALQTLTTIDLFYFIMCEDPHEWKFIDLAFGWGPGHTWFHTTLEGPWPHYMILEVCWDGVWTPSFGLPQFCGLGSWLVCEVALSMPACWFVKLWGCQPLGLFCFPSCYDSPYYVYLYHFVPLLSSGILSHK
jgi:hypothetical protein